MTQFHLKKEHNNLKIIVSDWTNSNDKFINYGKNLSFEWTIIIDHNLIEPIYDVF